MIRNRRAPYVTRPERPATLRSAGPLAAFGSTIQTGHHAPVGRLLTPIADRSHSQEAKGLDSDEVDLRGAY